jgi:GNAT superfamily N-acetyltransferase
MKKYLFIIIRKLLDGFRRTREWLRPLGPFLFKKLNPEDVVIKKVTEKDIALLERFLSFGDFAKHRKRLQAQNDRSGEYFIAWYLFPVGHIFVRWGGANDGPLKDRKEKEPIVEDLYIYPAARRKGIGKKLMEEAENAIRKKGYGTVGGLILTNNPSIEVMHRRRGYEIADLGIFETHQIFTDKKGRERVWSAKVKYIIKNLQNEEYEAES